MAVLDANELYRNDTVSILLKDFRRLVQLREAPGRWNSHKPIDFFFSRDTFSHLIRTFKNILIYITEKRELILKELSLNSKDLQDYALFIRRHLEFLSLFVESMSSRGQSDIPMLLDNVNKIRNYDIGDIGSVKAFFKLALIFIRDKGIAGGLILSLLENYVSSSDEELTPLDIMDRLEDILEKQWFAEKYLRSTTGIVKVASYLPLVAFLSELESYSRYESHGKIDGTVIAEIPRLFELTKEFFEIYRKLEDEDREKI